MSDKNIMHGICRATAGDKEAVMRILEETKFFRADEIVIAEEVFDGAITAGPAGDYQSYVARDGNKTIGWVCFGATACTVGTWDIYWVAVDPGYQGKGVGKALMEYATGLIVKSGGRLITVDTSGHGRYVSTRKFYESLGYVQEACIKDFYAVGDDKTVYIKRLN